MKEVLTYNGYTRNELIDLIKIKNKKIDSQRSMLNQLRVSRDLMKIKTKNLKSENEKQKVELNNLNRKVNRLTMSGKGSKMSTSDLMPVINAILRGFSLKKIIEITNNELIFLIIGYQREFFTQTHIAEFNMKCGRNPDFRWRKEFRDCCEAGLFHKEKIGRKTIYFISWKGRERLKNILEYLYTGKLKTFYA